MRQTLPKPKRSGSIFLWEGYLLKPGNPYLNLCLSDNLIPTYVSLSVTFPCGMDGGAFLFPGGTYGTIVWLRN